MANQIKVSFYLQMVSDKNQKAIKECFEYLEICYLDELLLKLQEHDGDMYDEDLILEILKEWCENKYISINNL